MMWTWQSVAPAKLAASASLIAKPAAEPSARAPNSRRVKPMSHPPSLVPHQQFQRRRQTRRYDHHAGHGQDAGGESSGRVLEHRPHIGPDEAAKCADGVDESKHSG